MVTCPTCVDLQRECDGLRIQLAEERERRMAAESLCDRLVGIINLLAERLAAFDKKLDQIIGMLGVRK